MLTPPLYFPFPTESRDKNRKPLISQWLPIWFVAGHWHLLSPFNCAVVRKKGQFTDKLSQNRAAIRKTADSRTAYTCREQKRPETCPGVGTKARPAQTKLSFITHRNGDHTATPAFVGRLEERTNIAQRFRSAKESVYLPHKVR